MQHIIEALRSSPALKISVHTLYLAAQYAIHSSRVLQHSHCKKGVETTRVGMATVRVGESPLSILRPVSLRLPWLLTGLTTL